MGAGRRLVLDQDTAEQEAASSTASAIERSTVLLVEDEDALRRVAGEVLQTAGYKVLEAKNGREALRLIERLTAEVDVLVADIVMPVMNGPELANELTLRCPNMRTIFISGYTDHPLLRRLRVPVRALYLHKPFSVEGLTGVVAQALAKK